MLDNKLPHWFAEANTDGCLGMAYDQMFYATRYRPGNDLSLPFGRTHFNAMISISVPVEEATLRKVALSLLEHGMRAAICHGDGAEQLGALIDELVDENGFAHDDRTVYSSVHDDEELVEVLDYFVLPNGLAETSLILVIGEEIDYEAAIGAFHTITAGLQEMTLVEV